MNQEQKTASPPALAKITSPEMLKALSAAQIPALCEEIREFLVEKVTATGGHLASNLGVVELTVALHRVFNSPHDRILWDVGHQSYVHKMLTGRQELFDTLRIPGGLSGFPTPTESEHDPFGAGHSSTAFSAALGFAEAERMKGSDRHTVAVVGDGAFTGGMVHEAMNNCRRGIRLTVVLNENEMSISRNIGKFAAAISRLRISRSYNRTKRGAMSALSRIPLIGVGVNKLLVSCKKKAKNALFGSNIFEDLGFFYIGPIDGNNEALVERALEEARLRDGGVIVHVKTKKGKGFPPAEEHPDVYHGITSQESATAFHEVTGKCLTELAGEDRGVCAITAAMGIGTGLSPFAAAYPDRYFDVGIAEEHAATFAAGLAAAGMKPYFAVYSTFLQRAYDNVLHDAALQDLPLRLLVDRAALSPGDGATHHGVFDVAFLSHIPNVHLWAPATFGSLKEMLRDSLAATHPLAIRYPNAAESAEVCRAFYPNGDYKSYGVRANYAKDTIPKNVILAYGRTAKEALLAAKRLTDQGAPTGVILLETLAPYGETAKKVFPLLPKVGRVLFLEEGIYNGGAGMLLGDRLAQMSPTFYHDCRYRVLAIRDRFAIQKESGCPLRYFGIDADAAVKSLTE